MSRPKKRVGSILLTLAMLLAMLPVRAQAVSNTLPAPDDHGVITLQENVEYLDSYTVAAGESVTIDLNGYTLDMGEKKITVNGALTIQDSGEDGKLIGTKSELITVNGNASLRVSGGTIETSGGTAVKLAYQNGISFTMTGGTISATGTAVNAMRGTVAVTGGEILTSSSSTGIYAIDNNYGKASITIGEEGGDNEAVYLTSVRGHQEAKLTFHSGIIGRIGGTINTTDVLDGLLESDISSILPAGLACQPEGNYYKVVPLTEENAQAKIDGTLYASAVSAAEDLQEGQTLVLLANVVGNTSTSLLKITAPNAIVELNGFSVTNENEKGNAISIAVPYGDSKNCTATIQNSGAATSTITAAIPLSFSSGSSSYQMEVALAGSISLNATTGQSVNLGTGAVMPYSETTADAYGNGGFKVTAADGNAYIYGSLAQAAPESADGKIELLNDYSGFESLSISSAGTYELDLKGHTFTSSHSDAALRLNGSNISLLVKNGKIVGTQRDGANVGIAPEGHTYNNVTLILDDVDLEVTSPDVSYGIVTNGTNTGNNLTLRNGTTLYAPNAVGIYWPSGDGVVAIDNSTITAHTGVQVCAGDLVITGANTAITATGTPEVKEENDGVIMDGAAISVVNRDGYDLLGKVAIQGGTYTSSSSSAAVKAYSFNSSNKEEEAWEDMDTVIEISGGTFSSIPAAVRECLSTGSGLQVNSDGSLSVVEKTALGNVASVTTGEVTTSYADLADAIAAVNGAASPVTLTLLQGQILTDTIYIDKNVDLTFDLGGNALVGPESGYAIQFGSFAPGSSAEESDYTNSGTLTLKNGTITCNGGVFNYFGSVVLDAGLTMHVTDRAVNALGGKVTVQGATVLSETGFGVALFNSFYAFDGASANMDHEKNKSAEFVMTSGTIDVSYYPITGNNLYSAGTTATITGGTLAADDNNPGIYWPMEGTLKVSGTARISGGTGIEAKMGTIEISGGAVISGMGAYVSSEPENGGSNPEGSALLLSSQMYGQAATQFKKDNGLTVTITGGTLSSNSGNAVTVYNTEKQTAQTTNVDISGGTLSGELAAIASVTTGSNTVTTEDQQQTVKKSNTTLTVSGTVAPVSIDANGSTTYYTSVAAAVAGVDPDTEDPTQISVFGNATISTDVELTEKISLVVAPNVTLSAQVTSGEGGMVLVTETDAQGNTVYRVVSAPAEPEETYAASITVNGATTYFDTLAHAVQAVQNGQTIQLLRNNGESITVSKELTFTLETNGNTFTGSLVAGPGYDFSVSGNTYVFVTYTPSYDHGSSGSSSGSGDYVISVDAGRHGDVSVSPTRADEGDTVTITVEPDKGYEVDKITVTDANGDSVRVRDRGDGEYTFTMPKGRVTVEVTFTAEQSPLSFVDVSDSDYYYDAVAWAVENGVTTGVTDTIFAPGNPCTRAQTVTFMWRAAGSPDPQTTVNPFTDISESDYYYEAVLWAVENGITQGITATTFGPGVTCTRAQVVTFLWRYDGSSTSALSSFADVSEGDYYYGAVAWAVENGVTQGVTDTAFQPGNPCTRGQIVTFLYRYMAA